MLLMVAMHARRASQQPMTIACLPICVSIVITRIAFVRPLQAPPTASERPTAAAPVAQSSGGDAGFWDRQVTEPEERQLQPANGAFVQQPAAAAESAAEAGSSNDLARLFAGMKVPGPPAAAPAAIPAPAAPTAAASMVLLTPQLLQQEAAGGAAQAEQGAATEPATAPGNLLLQSLLRGSQQAQQPPQALQQPAPAPVPRAVDITGKSEQVLRLLGRSALPACCS